MSKAAIDVLFSIREEHNLSSDADIAAFVKNLVKEVAFYKAQRDKLYRKAMAAEQIINNTRIALDISKQKELSILEAIQDLKRRAS